MAAEQSQTITKVKCSDLGDISLEEHLKKIDTTTETLHFVVDEDTHDTFSKEMVEHLPCLRNIIVEGIQDAGFIETIPSNLEGLMLFCLFSTAWTDEFCMCSTARTDEKPYCANHHMLTYDFTNLTNLKNLSFQIYEVDCVVKFPSNLKSLECVFWDEEFDKVPDVSLRIPENSSLKNFKMTHTTRILDTHMYNQMTKTKTKCSKRVENPN